MGAPTHQQGAQPNHLGHHTSHGLRVQLLKLQRDMCLT